MLLIFVLVIIIILASKKKKSKIIRCDGCKEIIEGKFIRVTEQDLKQPLDYCSKECKSKHIDRDRIHFADMEVE